MKALALPLLLLATLAACGTPQDRCISRATRDLRVVDDLIAESQRSLARGYALEERVDYRPEWVECGPPVVRTRKNGDRVFYPARRCFEQVPHTVREPVAIDLGAERRKLDQLLVKRRQLARQAEAQVAQCRATYPET